MFLNYIWRVDSSGVGLRDGSRSNTRSADIMIGVRIDLIFLKHAYSDSESRGEHRSRENLARQALRNCTTRSQVLGLRCPQGHSGVLFAPQVWRFLVYDSMI